MRMYSLFLVFVGVRVLACACIVFAFKQASMCSHPVIVLLIISWYSLICDRHGIVPMTRSRQLFHSPFRHESSNNCKQWVNASL